MERNHLLRNALIAELSELGTKNAVSVMKWVKTKEDVDNGEFSDRIYPDILFELAEGTASAGNYTLTSMEKPPIIK